MESTGRGVGRWAVAAALALIVSGPAWAAPSIQAVYTDYAKGGVPTGLNIVGSGFSCAGCAPPKVTLGGVSLVVTAHSAKVISVVLPQPLADGDYSLEVVSGPAQRAEVARFSLAVAAVDSAGTTSILRSPSRVRADRPPPPDLLRPATSSVARSTGPLSRSGKSSGKTSTPAAGKVSGAATVQADAVVVAGEASTDQVVTGLPAYNTAYGEYALFDLSRGYNSGTRGNSAFGYGALLKTTSGSYNNGFGFYALYNNVEGGYNSAFGNWALYSNTSGLQNSAFGHETLYSNTTGSENTASGEKALYSNTTGYRNTASGVGALFSNTTGFFNTATGVDALYFNTGGSANTANGLRALYGNTTGFYNTASGAYALYSNTTGYENTASGYQALVYNTTGFYNTASGNYALYSNTTGGGNTASGRTALSLNTTGNENTASGARALFRNSTGDSNTASGVDALYSNTTGTLNTANGYQALKSSTGNWNTASGAYALTNNSNGFNNTAFGIEALKSNTSGFNNTALGQAAGYNATTGSDNIYIGSEVRGANTDNVVMRIGNTTYPYKTFIAGIRGVTTGFSAIPVLIDGAGQLGTISSSARYKEDIQPMGSVSERLFALRPVTFRYQKPYQDGSKPVQFGLVAEEVAEVFPELVVYGKDGQPETVSYHLLATLLLNELQKEHRVSASLQEQVGKLRVQNEALVQANEAQVARMTALEQQVAVLAKAVGRTEKGGMVASTR